MLVPPTLVTGALAYTPTNTLQTMKRSLKTILRNALIIWAVSTAVLTEIAALGGTDFVRHFAPYIMAYCAGASVIVAAIKAIIDRLTND